MLEYDVNGYLKPYAPIPLSINLFEEEFVYNFSTSTTRRRLFNAYQVYNTLLNELLPKGFTQWVNGSFVTQKVDPNDFDLVTFIPNHIYERFEKEFNEISDLRHRYPRDIHGYLLITYPKEHAWHIRYEYSRIQWLYDFGTSIGRKKYPKGFIELTI